MATCDYATNLGGLYWDKEDGQFKHPTFLMVASADNPQSSFDSIFSQFNQDTLFVDSSCGIKTCDLSTACTDPVFASFQPLTSPVEWCTSDIAFSYVNPPVNRDEVVVQSGYTTGLESMEGNSAGAASGTDEKTTSARLSEENGTKDNCDDNSKNIEGVPNARAEVKLRSASRKPKRFQRKPAIAPNTQQARECHNNVEKQYRIRLKLRFERLLTVLPASRREDENPGELKPLEMNYCLSRGDVLDAARQHILALEEENKRLSYKIEVLSQDMMVG
ncbi:hypothetical protein LZL87_012835 [Fusarium oxysporum]|nr:hypothetical protein LZL87_012835 [Fusarium oxysporum]